MDEKKNLKEYIKGGWRHRWFAPDETPEVVAPFGKSIISEEGMKKIYKALADRIADVALRQNKSRMEEAQQQERNTKREENKEDEKPLILNQEIAEDIKVEKNILSPAVRKIVDEKRIDIKNNLSKYKTLYFEHKENATNITAETCNP